MTIIKELEKLKYELEKKTYGDSLDVWALVEILLKYFVIEKRRIDRRLLELNAYDSLNTRPKKNE